MIEFPSGANPKDGGMEMRSEDYWKIFLETGAPEAYLSYSRALKMEKTYVSDHEGTCAAGHGLQ